MNENPTPPWKIGVIVFATVAAIACGRAMSGGSGALSVGSPAPDVWGSAIQSGDMVELSDFQGKPVLIHFFATWCPPCMAEFPTVQEIEADYREKGLVVLSISLDNNEGQLRSFLEKKGVSWPVLYSGKGWRDDNASKAGVRGIPRIALVDDKGVVVADGLRGGDIEDAVREHLGG
jgi:thiol-disulfide isomerase/thioredoxin